jgi:nucleoside-diphosphate-sugar epimerase
VKVLVTGNLGYIGTVLTDVLASRGHEVTGLDVGYFEDCLLEHVRGPNRQIIRDVRDIEPREIEGHDAIIHLAGLSNDPLGALKPGLTDEINLRGTVRLAQIAKSTGIRRFVYASSQSMYGISKSESDVDEDESEKNPLTDYARTKWEAEVAIKKMSSEDFVVTCFRPSTVFGASARLRCDIVFNNLVACAFTTGRIEIKSDGTPWRPVVHVRDVCSAFIAGIEADEELVNGRSYNVGIPNGNYRVRDLAEAAQRAVPGSELVFTGEFGGDERTYRVSFNRILTELAHLYKPEWSLDRGGAELVEFFRRVGFTEADFRGAKTNRIAKLRETWSEDGMKDGLES